MNQSSTVSTGRSTIRLNRIKTYFSKPHNVILLIMGIVLTVTTVAPIVAIVQDTFKIHAGTIDLERERRQVNDTVGHPEPPGEG